MKRSTDEDRAAGRVGVKATRGEAALIFQVCYLYFYTSGLVVTLAVNLKLNYSLKIQLTD